MVFYSLRKYKIHIMDELRYQCEKNAVVTTLLRYWHRSRWIAVRSDTTIRCRWIAAQSSTAIRSDRRDLFGSVFAIVSVFILFGAAPVSAQVGVDTTEQVLCSPGSINIAQLITIGLGLMSAYFILKFLWRLMTGLDKAGEVRLDRDPTVDRMKKQRYLKLQIRDSSYSLIAALLPVLVPVFLEVAGIDTVSCLFG